MKVGVMQPYFFPYIGYWQLINAVNIYVIYDDVNYINRGWINRNNILINGLPKLVNLPLNKASQNKLINQIEVINDEVTSNKLLKTLETSYKKAPFFNEVYPLLENVLKQEEKNLAKYLTFSIKQVCEYLGIKTRFILSSEINKNNDYKGQDKILEICKQLNANEYINAIGGKDLYSSADFVSKGIHLSFLKTKPIKYKQLKTEFFPNLSIIDIMMFNSLDEINMMLNEYDLEQL